MVASRRITLLLFPLSYSSIGIWDCIASMACLFSKKNGFLCCIGPALTDLICISLLSFSLLYFSYVFDRLDLDI